MRINGVDAYLLSFPLPEPLKLAYHGGERTILKRDAMLIRVAGGRRSVRIRAGASQSARETNHRSLDRAVSERDARWRIPTRCACCSSRGRERIRK
jgi:hypothetical protein